MSLFFRFGLVDFVRLVSAEINVVSAMNAFGNSRELFRRFFLTRIPMCEKLTSPVLSKAFT